jgi:transcriptional regulator with XRE-family HTH domain
MSAPDILDIGLSEWLASAIRKTRLEFGWTQRELAARLKTNIGAVQRLERAQPHVDSQLATAAARLLGLRLSLDADPIGLAGRREQRDAIHAHCCGYVIGRLTRHGWLARSEVEIGEGRFRGWIDILAFRPADRALLVIEVKTALDDLGRTLRSLGWYVRSSREASRALGWRPRSIVPILLCLATVETDGRLAAAAQLLEAELPGRSTTLSAWLADPAAPTPAPSVALIDPRRRRSAWLIGRRSDGRRGPLPYRDARALAAAP